LLQYLMSEPGRNQEIKLTSVPIHPYPTSILLIKSTWHFYFPVLSTLISSNLSVVVQVFLHEPRFQWVFTW
jgi:hypothetical protein